MLCSEAEDQMPALSAGELPQDMRRHLLDHLSTCDQCRAALARIDVLATVLSPMPQETAPRFFAEKVIRAARKRRPTESPHTTWPWWRAASFSMRLTTVAVIVLGISLGLMMGSTTLPAARPTDRLPSRELAQEYQMDCLQEAPEGSLAESYLTFALPPEGI